MYTTAAQPVGILLAAGRGRRFDASGRRNKLLQTLDGVAVVRKAADNLRVVLPLVVAVVRRGDQACTEILAAAGCPVVHADDEGEGMSASLRCGLAATADAAGWIFALGDMPFVAPSTIRALLQALDNGASIAAPVFAGRRGNPIAFSRTHLSALQQLRGDHGARSLLDMHRVTLVEVDDPGILRDIDTETDLHT